MANSGTLNGAIATTDVTTTNTNLQIGSAAFLSSPVGVSNGGTGISTSSFTTGGLWVGNGTSAIQQIAPAGAGYLFVGATSSAGAWAQPTSSDGSVTLTLASGAITVASTTATTSQLGASVRATAAESVTGTDASKYITPSTLTSRLAAPGTIGGTTPDQGTFTTITLTSSAGPQINTGSGAPSASVPKGSLYMRTDGTTTNNRAYTATDAVGTYTAFVTVA